MCSHVLIAFNEGEHLNGARFGRRGVRGRVPNDRPLWKDDDDGATRRLGADDYYEELVHFE